MKISLTSGRHNAGPFDNGQPTSLKRCNREAAVAPAQAGFTMMEIAISLAIIGIALVAIIGVLPIGMNVQQDNRQQTIVGEDASVFLEAIRNGTLGLDDLTNYVYAVTNYWAEFNPLPKNFTNHLGVNGYSYSGYSISPNYYVGLTVPTAQMGAPINDGANIIGLMSTPEITDIYGNPTNNLYSGGYSNHIVVYAYSISGLAVEKPPQDNQIIQQGAFGYRIFCVNAPYDVNTNDYFQGTASTYEQYMANNVHELRLTFLWPQLANGNVGSGRQTFRTLVAGQLGRQPTNTPANSFNSDSIWYNTNFYYYQAQEFATNTP
jgi:prepilin-type N-terminal cleavage/methylation domain-containing protein